jgi:hypothetical protein
MTIFKNSARIWKKSVFSQPGPDRRAGFPARKIQQKDLNWQSKLSRLKTQIA